MAQDKNLPEGTDKIIAGASGSSTGGAAGTGAVGDEDLIVAETTIITAEVVPAPSADGAGRSSRRSGTTGDGTRSGGTQAIRDKVRAGSEKLSGQAADKARGLVGQGLERGGEALTNVGRLVSDTAPGLDERLGAEYGDYARRAAETIDNVAQSLRSKDPDELIDDTRNFVRKSPGVALAGAAIVGFALARLIKSGLDANRSEDDGTSGTDERRGGGGAA